MQGFRLSRRVPVGDNGDEIAARGNYAYLLQGAGVAVLPDHLCCVQALRDDSGAGGLRADGAGLRCRHCSRCWPTNRCLPLSVCRRFATPILVSTGSGNHVALFSYYLLLNLAIGIVAWLRAWRALNLLGFFATFGWRRCGALWHVPENYATTQPFLIAFFAIYVLIGLFYALRHAGDGSGARWHRVIFGTPIVSFLLQTQLVEHFGTARRFRPLPPVRSICCWRCLCAAGRPPGSGNVAQWLTMSYAALALIFATLAVPLAVDGRMTAAIWAIEGAGVFWLATGRRA